ncbi:MAG: hypothetical protein ACI8S6_003965, partial [Myxococcota bacterium]
RDSLLRFIMTGSCQTREHLVLLGTPLHANTA